MTHLDLLLIISLSVVVYTYFFYPLILWMWGKCRRVPLAAGSYQPHVTVLISAYNEETCIGETIKSILQSNYPSNLLDLLVVSDGSSDRTDDIVSSFAMPQVRLLKRPHRGGKTSALAMAAPMAPGDILLLADASSVFSPDTVARLMTPFSDVQVGSVVGRKVIRPSGSVVASGDGLYWKYDSWLRDLESRTGSSWVGCEGGIYAVRKELLRFDFSPTLAEDYSVCCRIFEQQHVNRYDPKAMIYESASQDMSQEFSRKVRVIVRGILAFFVFGRLLNPIKNPGFFFQNVSHRLCRWLVPFFLIALLITSAFSTTPFGMTMWILQLIFYTLATAGAVLKFFKRKFWLTSVPLYFTIVNAAGLLSWFLLFRDYGAWSPTSRERVEAC